MAQSKRNSKGKSVKIIDPEDVEVFEYDRDILKEQIIDKYGAIERYTNISLYRANAKGEYENLNKYEDQLPDWMDIKREFGGGKFRLFIQWYDEDEKRHMDTRYFKIEGSPITPNPLAPPGSLAVNSSSDHLLNTIHTLKDLGLIGQQKSNDMALVIQTMKDNTTMMVKMFENLNKKDPDSEISKILSLVLPKAFEKGDQGEIEKFVKVYSLINKLAPKGGGGTGETDVISLITGLMSKVPGLGGGIPAPGIDPGAMVAPGADANNPLKLLLDTLQNINDTVVSLKSDMSKLWHDYYDEDPEQPEQPVISNNGNTTMNNKDQEQENTWRKLAAEFITLPEDKKAQTLKVYLLLYPQKDVYEIFIKYGFGKTLEEFNKYCVKAGFPELAQPILGQSK